ncbi:MAG: ABC transporter substrate-binding protein [Deltaproteobacteria bacterium]|nr:ABC transporter substrate-binding protein [Deltaproteobacteria bacterium]
MPSEAKQSNLKVLVSVISFLLFLAAGVEVSRSQQPQWKEEWKRTVTAAKKEGKLVYHAGSASAPYLREFQKRYPEIKATRMLTRGGSAAAQRLMAERRAGLYASDILIMGGTSGTRLANAGVLDPLEPNFILPEILDRSKWWGGKYHYLGKKSGYIFVFAMTPRPFTGYNTDLVKPASLKSYWDLLKPEWKGKMVALEPGRSVQGFLRFLYHNPKLGPKFIRQLIEKAGLTYSRSGRQVVDWLGTGKFAIALFISPSRSGLVAAKSQGLPVDWFSPQHFIDGVPITGGPNNVSLVNRAPHPNAARLFINWFLSREGQTVAQKVGGVEGGTRGVGVDSLRIDIPKDDVPMAYRRLEGVKYFYTENPEYMNMEPILKLIKEARGMR